MTYLYSQKKKIVNKIFDDSIKTGIPFRYSGKYENHYVSLFTKFMEAAMPMP